MTGIFERAQLALAANEGRMTAHGAGDPPDAAVTESALALAETNVDPSVLVEGTRGRHLKAAFLRTLKVFTSGQVRFNLGVLRWMKAWDAWLRTSVDASHSDKITLSRERALQVAATDSLTARCAKLEQEVEQLQRLLLEVQTSFQISHDTQSGILSMTREKLERVSQQQGKDSAFLHEWANAVNPAVAMATENASRIAALEEKLVELEAGSLTDDSGGVLSDGDYFEFQDRFRGSREEIEARQKLYLPFLQAAESRCGAGPAKFLDLGCGRGEMVELACMHGHIMTGVETNRRMVEHCRARGLKVTEADMFSYLKQAPESSLTGVVALQVVEHLPYTRITELIELIHSRLKPGGCLILETINPASVHAMKFFYMDPTHIQPVPSETLAFLVKSRGFVEVQQLFLNAVSGTESFREEDNPQLWKMLYGYQDYAVIASKF